MKTDLQKASFGRRIMAWILDAILVCILAVAFAWILSAMLNYETKLDRFNDYCDQYASEYGTSFEYTQEEYSALSEQEQKLYNDAYTALWNDEEVSALWNTVVWMTLMMCSLSTLLAILVWEFAIPLWLGNGQTLCKKMFGIAVMRTHGIKINGVCLFIRSVLGKYAIETMIPVYVAVMWMLGVSGGIGLLLVAALLLTQLIMLAVTRNRCPIHDKLADTVVVDMYSQMIFADDRERLEYQQREAAEEAARQAYF